MKTNKILEGLKKVDWVDVGVLAVGALGLVLGNKQKQNETREMNETIKKEVEKAIHNK